MQIIITTDNVAEDYLGNAVEAAHQRVQWVEKTQYIM